MMVEPFKTRLSDVLKSPKKTVNYSVYLNCLAQRRLNNLAGGTSRRAL